MKVILNQPKEFIVQSEMREIASEYEVTRMLDLPSVKKVVVTVSLGSRVFSWALWEGASYDAIGQWTDADVIQAISTRIQDL